jgi:chromosome segregation ATPase
MGGSSIGKSIDQTRLSGNRTKTQISKLNNQIKTLTRKRERAYKKRGGQDEVKQLCDEIGRAKASLQKLYQTDRIIGGTLAATQQVQSTKEMVKNLSSAEKHITQASASNVPIQAVHLIKKISESQQKIDAAHAEMEEVMNEAEQTNDSDDDDGQGTETEYEKFIREKTLGAPDAAIDYTQNEDSIQEADLEERLNNLRS